MLDKTTFNNWLSEFFNKKSNELEYSRVSQPKRMEKITLNLATASVDPLQINVPFKTMIVSRIYSTAVTTTDKAGTIKIMFDQDNISNIKNAISLFPNDTLRSGTLVTKAFLSWDAQSDTSVDLYFYPDIEVIAGTTKTQIVGSVTVQNTSASSLFTRSAVPTVVTRLSRTSAGTSTRTIPAGYYGIVTGMISGGGTGASITVGGTLICNNGNGAVGNFAVSENFVLAGEIVDVTTSGGNGYAWAQIAEFPIT